MQHLATVTGEEGKVEKQLLQAHPILEGKSTSLFIE
jgi:hypothetical protein